MNAERPFADFDRLSEAPEAVPRLRRFILDLAVRGKLVEQNPADEAAAVILAATPAPVLPGGREGRLSRVFPTSDEIPFSVPLSWLWCRPNQVGVIVGGGTPPTSDGDNFAFAGMGTPWLTPADMRKHHGGPIERGARDLTPKGLAASSATLLPKGTVLFTSRAPIGYVAVASGDVTTNQGFKSLVPSSAIDSDYAAIYFRAFVPWFEARASGTTFKEVPAKLLATFPLPLPPIAEQHRIVAKVDELMALCDEFEAARAERDLRRDRFVRASLHRVVTASEPATFKRQFQFLLEHSDHVLARQQDIGALRTALLEAAIRGRLVPQDPGDEPARSLLDRIQQEAIHTRQNGANKRRALPSPAEGPRPFSAPSGWAWTDIGHLYPEFQNGASSRGDAGGTPTVVLRLADIRDGEISFDGVRQLPIDEGAAGKFRLAKDDLLVVRVNGSSEIVGRFIRCKTDTDAIYCDHFIRMRLPSIAVLPSFIRLLGDSPLVRQQVNALFVTSAGQKTVNQTHVASLRIPLPPIAEQRRIVAKVDELMRVCDELERSLNAIDTSRVRLLEAELHEALAEGSDAERVLASAH